LVCCTQKNPATLVLRPAEETKLPFCKNNLNSRLIIGYGNASAVVNYKAVIYKLLCCYFWKLCINKNFVHLEFISRLG
jgi:hypothetical protein